MRGSGIGGMRGGRCIGGMQPSNRVIRRRRRREIEVERGREHDALEQEGSDGGAATQSRRRFAPPHVQRGRGELRDVGRRGVRQRDCGKSYSKMDAIQMSKNLDSAMRQVNQSKENGVAVVMVRELHFNDLL